MFPHQLTPDLSLELLEPRHTQELFDVVDGNRNYLREWLPWVDDCKAAAVTAEFIQETLKQLVDNNGFQTAILWRGTIVGAVGHHGIDWDRKHTELGYWLAEAYQGRGIITRSCRAYVDHAFRTLGLQRVEIKCAVDNTKSRAIAERLGFRLDQTVPGSVLVNDGYVDGVVYAMLAGDWDG